MATWKRNQYPWDDLKKVGDSFLIPSGSKATNVRQLVYAANKREGYKKFVAYVHPDGSASVTLLV